MLYTRTGDKGTPLLSAPSLYLLSHCHRLVPNTASHLLRRVVALQWRTPRQDRQDL